MRRRHSIGPRRAITVLGLIALAIGFLGTPVASMASAATDHASALSKIQPCTGKPVIKPSSYVIACADANIELLDLSWRTWKASSAAGSGRYTVNTCTPTCVAGKYVHYLATVTLSKPKSEKTGSIFSRMVITYRPTPKKLVTSVVTLPLKAF